MRFFFKDKYTLSLISIAHYQKLVLRSLMFALGLAIYLYGQITGHQTEVLTSPVTSIVLVFLACWFMFEMASRLVPSPIESMGCEKQFYRNLDRTDVPEPMLLGWKRTLLVILSWLVLNGAIGAIYLSGGISWIDTGFMYLLCLAYAVCDMICILFFCPFQSWMMKNKCCSTCRIYNWDYPMMFTPLVFIPSIPTYIVLGMAVIVLIVWEYRYRRHPERFSEATNASLSCSNCNEKLCRHKKQLSRYLDRNRDYLRARGELLTDKLRADIEARQKSALEALEDQKTKIVDAFNNAPTKKSDQKPSDYENDKQELSDNDVTSEMQDEHEIL